MARGIEVAKLFGTVRTMKQCNTMGMLCLMLQVLLLLLSLCFPAGSCCLSI